MKSKTNRFVIFILSVLFFLSGCNLSSSPTTVLQTTTSATSITSSLEITTSSTPKTTSAPTTLEPTTSALTTLAPITAATTTVVPTTVEPTTIITTTIPTTVTTVTTTNDSVPPTITILGDAYIHISVFEDYVELGASCVDNLDDTCTVMIESSSVNTSVIGEYTVTYHATDTSGNEADPVTRTIIVEDTLSPTITLIGDADISVDFGSDYVDIGATCIDNYDPSCEVFTDISDVNTNSIGTYTVTYTATDTSGNGANEIRIVRVVDTVSPTIVLNGDGVIHLEVGSSYNEFGATCTDNVDDSCDVFVDSSLLNTLVLGSYSILYSAIDSSGNTTVETRTVVVEDTTSPEIVILGENVLYLDIADEYIDLGATCADNYDSICQVSVDASAVDFTSVGTYPVTYSAVDSSGNLALPLSRTIVVQNQLGRVIRLSSSDVVYHIVNQAWTNPSLYVPIDGSYSATRQGSVDPNLVGTNVLRYVVTDEFSNVYVLSITVHVVELLPNELDIVSLENIYNLYPTIFQQLSPTDVNRDLVLNSVEIANVKTLNLHNLGLQQADFLKYYPSLESLDVSHNQLTNINFVSSMPSLKVLNAESNLLGSSDLSVLTDNQILTSLDISNNSISSLSSLTGLTALESLRLANNFVTDLASMGDLPSLLNLDVEGNPIDTMDDIVGYLNLESLYIDNTDITDITGIGNLASMQVLSLSELIVDYYEIDYLLQLTDLFIVDLDADLENTFFFEYLRYYGVNVEVHSQAPYDSLYPNILLFDQSATITLGETFDFSNISYIAFDAEDLYLYDPLSSSVQDTSILGVGEHVLTLSIPDLDGHISSVSFTLTVIDNYDLGNLVVFIRFADETEFTSPNTYEYYDSLFNGQTNSLQDYYLEVSNNTFNIDTVLPSTEIVFFTDSHDRGYYQPYDAATNPIGYSSDSEAYDREYNLLSNAIYWLDDTGLVDESVVLDYNLDGEVDVVTFLVSGHVDGWSDLIWPHKYAFYDSTDYYEDFYTDAPAINGEYVYNYTFQLIGDYVEESSYFNLGVFAHEMFHIIGATDLYHYYSEDDINSVGNWDIMDGTTDIPSHMLLYMKEYYGLWDQDEVMVATDGTYNLNVSTALNDNLIIIDLGYSNEYLYIEYRKQTGDYEINLPNEGVIIYRVDKDYEGEGNVDGYYSSADIGLEEVFVFRPFTYDPALLSGSGIYYIVDDGDPDLGNLQLSGNDQAGPNTNIPLFYSDGTAINIVITVISESDGSVQIAIDFLAIS